MRTIDHINRYVSNVDKFIDFYQAVLDYRLIDKGTKGNGKNYAILKGEGHELFISEKEDYKPEDNTNFRHIGYSIDDILKLSDNLKLAGYLDSNTEIITKAFSKQFYIKDPDGFEIDMIQWTNKEGFYQSLKYGNQ